MFRNFLKIPFGFVICNKIRMKFSHFYEKWSNLGGEMCRAAGRSPRPNGQGGRTRDVHKKRKPNTETKLTGTESEYTETELTGTNFGTHM
jgi:hypothetical protein